MDLNVVILSWNARADTLRCLSRLKGWQRIEPRIWVVDNGSDPDDSAALAAACPSAVVIRSAENLGFSGGTNLGLRHVLEGSDAPVLLLNNDVDLGEEAAAALVATLGSERRCGIVGPLILSASQPPRILSAGNRSPVFHRDHAITTPPAGREVYSVEFVSGAAVLIRTCVLREVGLLHEPYFFGLELADLCRRARGGGYQCLVNTRSRVQHDVHRSPLRDTLYVYYVVRNRLLYARRFHRATWPALLAAWSLYGLQQAVRLWLKNEKRGTAAAIALGVRDGVAGRFGNRNDHVLRVCAAHPNAGPPS